MKWPRLETSSLGVLQLRVSIDLTDLLFSHHFLRGAFIERLTTVHRISTMATAAFVAPHFIQEDFFTQDLMQDLHRLEGRRAQAQDDYQRQASDDIAATLLHYTMELEDMRLIMRDRLLALTLGHGDEVDDALVRGSFGGPTSQAQAQPGAVTGHTSELGGNIIPGLAALELEPDEERRAPNSGPRRLNPRATPVALAEPRAILPRVVASGAGLLDSPPPV